MNGVAPPAWTVEKREDGESWTLSDGNIEFGLCHGLPDTDLREPKKYKIYPCFSRQYGESQTSTIRMSGSHETLGYLLPITSFRGEEGFPDEWSLRFARVALEKLISPQHLSNFAAERATPPQVGEDLLPDDIFDDRLSVAVFGNWNLDKVSIQSEHVHAMMLEHYVIPADISTDLRLAPDYRKNLSVRPPSGDLSDVLEILTGLIIDADFDKSALGRFLKYYQTFEICFEKIYSAGVNALVDLKLKPYAAKKKLDALTSDRTRLGILAAHCLSPNRIIERFDDLGSRCLELLSEAGAETETQDWAQRLYLVRNLMVHEHIRVLQVPHEKVEAVNEALRAACCEIITNFVEPNLQDAWKP
jgi:hypothetical protein